MKNEKKLCRFSYYRNIANFEAFWRDKNFSKNLLFLGSVTWFLIFIMFFNYTLFYKQNFHTYLDFSCIFVSKLEPSLKDCFWKLSLKMCNCSCNAGFSNFSTYEWITMVTQILTLLVLALILFNVDEKYIEKHVWNAMANLTIWNII